jgi:anaerobic selenocysteine-containing dehydrogenase
MSATTTTNRRIHRRTCPLCEATCGLEITTEGDRVVRIRGDRDDPVSRGFICPKGSTLKQLHEDPDRLTAPVIRTDDGWRTVTWDEAFAEIERRLKPVVDAHGRDALAVVLGNPNVHNLGGMIYLRHVIQAAGSKRRFSASTVDQMPKHVSAGLMWGDPAMFPLPDIERTDYLLMLGANPWESNGSLVSIPDFPGRLQELRARGARFVVVDPRRTRTATEADEHLTIRPGTDVLWLLALANVIVADGLVDVGRLADHVAGLDEACAAVEPYTPEAVADACGIGADTTRRIAHELATAPSAAVYGRIGNHTVAFGTLASWAADLLNVLTGNLDRPGGVMFDSGPSARIDERAPGGRGFAIGRWHSPVTGRPEVLGELPAATLAEEIEGSADAEGADGIKALFLLACNPVRSFPNSERLDAAFAGLDLLVAVDPYINASTRHAHVILPPTSALERSHYDVFFERNMIRSFARYSPPVFDVDRPGEPEILSRLALVISGFGADADPALVQSEMMRTLVSAEVDRDDGPLAGRDAEEILAELARWSWAEQVIDLRLRTGRFGDRFGVDADGLTLAKLRDDHPSGIDFGPLVERFPSAIRTPSGAVELFPGPIADDLERLAAAPPGSVDGLVLVGRRHLRSCNTWMHNVDVLVKGKERCTLQVHPDDAAAIGLADGGRATVRSRVGEVTAPVEITDEVMAGVVSLPFGWGHDTPGIEMQVARSRPGVNSNILTDDTAIDELSGNAVLNAIPVTVAPA